MHFRMTFRARHITYLGSRCVNRRRADLVRVARAPA